MEVLLWSKSCIGHNLEKGGSLCEPPFSNNLFTHNLLDRF